MGVDISGIPGTLIEKFTRLRLESWRGGWAYKPEHIEGSNWLILEGSPAKAGTGQNIYLPEGEGLARGIMYGLEPFLLELRELCLIDLGYIELRKEVLKLLLRGFVQRIDFTSHFDLGDFVGAQALLASVDANRGGIFYKSGGSVMRWRRHSDTSLVCGSGRRWGAKLYIKQAEIVVQGHCPSLQKFDLYNSCDGWVRYEYTIRGELLTPSEKPIAYWTAPRIREFRSLTLTKIFWPGQTYSSKKRFQRRRVEVDMTPAIVARKVMETELYLGDVGPHLHREALVEMIIKSIYSEKRFEYDLVDLFDEPRGTVKMRKRDIEIFKSWEQGVDVYRNLNPNTARRIRNNILKAHGVDIKTRKDVSLPDFGPVPIIRPVVYDRDWKHFLVA